MSGGCNIKQVQETIDSFQTRNWKGRNQVCSNIERSFPAFILANFEVDDWYFYALTDEQFDAEIFVQTLVQNLKTENRRIIVKDVPAPSKENKHINFQCNDLGNELVVSWNFSN
ncbi:MAG: hypothetical protein CL840_06615 [Crocinitomicaceae bacterium]|nr:hypothetical protein [Crocinitomicaceae bacterium]